MATETKITDDLDGSEGAVTRTFTVGSDIYEIDLNEQNYRKLQGALEPFTSVARHTVNKPERAKELQEQMKRGLPR
jgi:hypothetical protein